MYEPLKSFVARSILPFESNVFFIISITKPDGSMSNEEVIAAANEHNLAMVFTGIRCFKH
jgi:AICAR transformylase/IMP cyclohydrolase PurH